MERLYSAERTTRVVWRSRPHDEIGDTHVGGKMLWYCGQPSVVHMSFYTRPSSDKISCCMTYSLMIYTRSFNLCIVHCTMAIYLFSLRSCRVPSALDARNLTKIWHLLDSRVSTIDRSSCQSDFIAFPYTRKLIVVVSCLIIVMYVRTLYTQSMMYVKVNTLRG